MNFTANLASTIRQSSIGQGFMARSKSDRMVIVGIAVFTVLVAIYSLIWKPLADFQAASQIRHGKAQELADWIALNNTALREARQSGGATGDPSEAGLIPLITNMANQTQLKLNRLKPENNGSVSVNLQEQSFSQVVEWLDGLESKHGITVARASIDQGEKSGYVNAQIRLAR